ncbi:MAG: polyisoprenoid-binding protein [Elusimicrobia bacterium]|nr:polyisoprenoid-binding protein [Elusimicrobiota bacterium]
MKLRRWAWAVVLASASGVRAETYTIDPDHSQVAFRIRHLVGKVSGRFSRFEGQFDYSEGKPAAWKAQATIDAASIDTNNKKRDDHLRAPDFFDAQRCPKMEFKSARVTDVNGNRAKLHGDLTMHCLTKPVALDLEAGGVGKDPWGNMRAGFTATGKIDRKDFGINWNKVLDAGGAVLGDEVEIMIEIEGIMKSGASKKA